MRNSLENFLNAAEARAETSEAFDLTQTGPNTVVALHLLACWRFRCCFTAAGGGDGQAAPDGHDLLLGHQTAGGGEADGVADLLEVAREQHPVEGRADSASQG